MVVKCLVCPNKYGSLTDITFHRFPLSAFRCMHWAVLCRRNDLTDVDPTICNRLYKLCSRHFDESQFIGNRLIHNAVPSKFEWNGYLNEQQEITNESNNLEIICPQLEVTGNMQVPRFSNNECSEKDECTDNVSENEEDNIDINLIIEDTPDTNKLNDTNSSFIESSSQQSTSSTKKLSVQKKQRPIGLEDVNKVALDFFSKKKKIDNMKEDVDLCFFKSVLPDMKLMNSEQKRRFKDGILNLAESILNEQIPSVTQQIGNQVNYSTSSNLSSSSASTPLSPPLNLAQQSSILHQNNVQDSLYD